MKVTVVIPVGAGREENLKMVLESLRKQTVKPYGVVIVEDGPAVVNATLKDVSRVRVLKHQPGAEQPRNVGVRAAKRTFPATTHVWFLDSDVIVAPNCLKEITGALDKDPRRILVCPYDWLPPSVREPKPSLRNDPRWPSFDRYHPDELLQGDLAAGLACFSGNLVWPVPQFEYVGGFWAQIHHGRCEDGELGLRAAAMGIPISFVGEARGWHLHHVVNTKLVLERNKRDVPMINRRHPWVQDHSRVFMVDRDGQAFDVECATCKKQVPTIQWWQHAEQCGAPFEIPIEGELTDVKSAGGNPNVSRPTTRSTGHDRSRLKPATHRP